MSARLDHEAILASAGSGKTWQLTTRYLRLVAAGAAPSSILATTFTRAAAAEIRERIVRRAVAALDDEEERAHLAPPGSARLDAADARALLDRLVHDWHRLQVRTIDSVLGGLAACFGFELGVPPGTTVLDPVHEPALRAEATLRLLSDGDARRYLSLLRQVTAGADNQDVEASIDQAVGSLYELWREAPAPAWEWQRDGEAPSDDEALEVAAQLTAALDGVMTSGVKCHSNLPRALQQIASGLAARDFRGVAGSTILCRARQGDFGYYKSTLPEPLARALRDVVSLVERAIGEDLRLQTRATRDLIAEWSVHLEAVKRERGVVTFADFPLLVAGAERLGTLEEIGFRLDATLHHLLLDEMQDTSLAQWRALRPFAEEILAQEAGERSFFAVGDLKQCIYTWRGAIPEILEALASRPGVERLALDETRRCAPAIVDAVNAVFHGIDRAAALTERRAAGDRFGTLFTDHRSAAEAGGYAEFRVGAAAPPDGKPVDGVVADAVALVRRLHAACPGATIGVLVRKREMVARLLHDLGAADGSLEIAGRGGSPLIDAAPVGMALSLLQLAAHPGDSAAAFHVAHSPLAARAELVVPAPGGAIDMAAAARLSAAVRRAVSRDGLAAALRPWVLELCAGADRRQQRRLVQLLEFAATWEGRPDAAGLDSFIRAVRDTDVADEAEAPIQVMTVHQSKGLEFDLVVLPDLGRTLAFARTPAAAFERSRDGAAVTRIMRWIRQECVEWVAGAPDVRRAHETRQVVESLCLLYVAMTRARRGLYAIVPALGRGATACTPAALLRETSTAADEPGALLRRFGDEATMLAALSNERPRRDLARKPGEAPREDESPIILADTTLPLRTRLAPPSRKDGATLGEGLRAVRPEIAEARERGVVMHALFEQIEWLDDGMPGDERLRDVVYRIAPRRDRAWVERVLDGFRTALRHEEIRSLLSRPDDAAVTLHRERRFVRLRDAGMQSGTIDRLVLRHDQAGRVAEARVIDFKTDLVEADGLDALLERYLPQIRAYGEVVAEQYALEPAQVEMVLAFAALGRVVAYDH